jgi:16S rRNA (guanine(1405)-N(7))-methyltransferase
VNRGPGVDSATAGVLDQLRRSRKYRDLSEATLVRVARWALRTWPDERQATKAAKRKLHQVYAAYLTPSSLAAAEEAAAALSAGGCSAAEKRSACLEAMRHHASTAERLPFLERFYRDLAAELPKVRSVLDLGCGLNPFAVPWMTQPLDRYVGVDVDERLVVVVNRLDGIWPVRVTGLSHDLASGAPAVDADVVLLLKVIPCLEQQEAGATRRLLAGLRAPWVVASFPARSLGGRAKRMPETYDRLLASLATGWDVRRTRSYPTEVAYFLARSPGGR